MMGGWRESTWGDEISLEYGKGIRGYAEGTGPYRVFGSNGAVGWADEALAPGPGVILGRKGAYRGVRFSAEPFYVIDTAYYVVPKSELDMRWLYYAIIHHKLGEIDDGSPIPSTTRSAVYVREVSVPLIQEQREIAAVLSALDDKIELNRRMNETLEASARALFRDWFVDFGPTRAKMEGRPAYLAPDLWSLFPDRLDDDGKPEGWRAGVFSDVASAVNQKADPNEIDAETPYIGLEHMPRQSIALDQWEAAGKVSSTKSAFQSGQILFGKLRPYFHKVGVAPVSGICSTDIVVMEARRPELATLALACASTEEFVAYSDQSSTGTKMPRTSWSIMGKYPLVQANKPVNIAFERMAGPMIETIKRNIHESRTLAETRDLLLPKLMSGEIRVRNVHKMVGDDE